MQSWKKSLVLFCKKLDQKISKLEPDPGHDLRAYRKNYRLSLDRKLRKAKPISIVKFAKAIQRSDLVIFGDFHPFPASQRSILNFIKNSKLKLHAFGFEVLPSHRPPDWKNWREYLTRSGFPVADYEKLLEHFTKAKLPILGLNRPEWVTLPKIELDQTSSQVPADSDHLQLFQRDLWTAGVLLDHLKKKPKKPIGVLYGDFHLGKDHLPEALLKLSKSLKRKPPKTLTVHQNEDSMFWKFFLSNKPLTSEVVYQLSENEYILLGGTPWSKRQSWANWILGDEFLPPQELAYEKIRFASHLFQLWSGIEPFPLEVLKYQFQAKAEYERHELLFYTHAPDQNEWSLYFPAVTDNMAFEWIGILFRALKSDRPFLYEPKTEEDYLEWKVRYTFGFFISKIFNPFRQPKYIGKSNVKLIETRRAGQILGEALFTKLSSHPKHDLRKWIRNFEKIRKPKQALQYLEVLASGR